MKLSSFFSREQLLLSIRDIFSRFFQAAIVSIMLTLYICYKIIQDASSHPWEDDVIARTITSLILIFFLSLWVTLFYETSERKYIDNKFPILPIVYWFIFYFTVRFSQNYSFQWMTYFLLHLTGFISFAFFLPYVRKIFRLSERERNAQNVEYSNYYSRVSWTFLMSAIVGFALVILGIIAISSVVSLFELAPIIDEEKYYGVWVTLSLAFIAPFYGLKEFPKAWSIQTSSYEVNKFFSFLIRYIATPAVYIYFIILYAYSIKVLLNFSDWPKNIITWLVIGFSSFGYLTYIFSKPYEDSSGMIRFFRKWFPLAVIPQLLMLFYAIGLRIYQYDLTTKRYFVVAFGIWLLVTSVYFSWRKFPLLAFVPASLALISFVISLGPWGVFSYPFSRQESRLLHNLETAKILQGGKIVPLLSERDISKELSTDIASGIEYLCQFDDCKRIKEIFPDQVAHIEKTSKEDWEKWNKENTGTIYPGVYYWELQSGIARELKVNQYRYDEENRDFPEQEYLYYNVTNQGWQYPMEISWYNKIIQVKADYEVNSYNTDLRYPYISVNADTREARYFTASGSFMAFKLPLSEKLLDSATLSNLNPEDLTFEVGNDAIDIRIILQTLSIKNPKYLPKNSSSYTYYWWSTWVALVKIKK